MVVFSIAGLNLSLCVPGGICSAESGRLKAWHPFRTDDEAACACRVSLVSATISPYLVDVYPIQEEVGRCCRFGQDLMLVSEAWDVCTILAPCEDVGFQVFTNQAFLTHATQHHMIQLHASLIDDCGRGVLFLGPSGVGKTTQAEQWMHYRGASIINGDMVFVQKEGPQRYRAWGGPWHGSSPWCLNASAPVKALVVLNQARENRLVELSGFEKVSAVSGGLYYPTWQDGGIERCTDILGRLLSEVPVYRLDNRADRAAVDVLAAELDRIAP